MGNKFFIKSTGLLNASGKDLIDFLNRMSTNDFKKLPPLEFRKTVLTTDKGRVVDLINVLNLPENILILTSNDFEDKIISHLDKYIIMDDVKLEKENSNNFHISIFGDDLKKVSEKMFNTQIESNKIYTTGTGELYFMDNFKVDSFNIICSKEKAENFRQLLAEDMEEMNCEQYEFLRIDSGIPEGSNELNDQINPMECGLGEYISFNKGCYIGQEVIARLDSQGKRPKQMVKIKSDSSLLKGDKIFTDDDKETGFVSSIIMHDGSFYALGFIRSINLDYGRKYFVEHNSQKIQIEISKAN